MRKLVLLLLLTGTALSAFAARRVTVEQLERLLAAAHGKPDAKVAQQLSNLELTERLSAASLSRWEADLPGPESRRSLVVLADVSAFLDPPAADIPATATPDRAAQKKMLALTVDYAAKIISKLPNFFATRDTIFFEDTPQSYRADMSAIPYQPLHPVGRSSDTVLYRDGREVVDAGAAKQKKHEPGERGLTTSGVFGPILGTVLVDAAQGKLSWGYWEQGAAGPVAVYRFVIPRDKSHYQVKYCCVSQGNGDAIFRQYSGYHGEIDVDPANGAILRLALQADLEPSDPLLRSDILVEYGPVEVGGKTYVCPVKSVSMTVAPSHSNGPADQRYYGELLDKDNYADREHLQTMLNDVAFVQYQIGRASCRILTGESAEPSEHPPASGLAEMQGAGSLAGAEKPMETVPAEISAAAAPAAPGPVSTPAQSFVPEPVPADQEMHVAESVGLPEFPATP